VAEGPAYSYWAACPQLPGEFVQYIADPDRTTQVTYRTFARQADLAPLRRQDHPAMYRISAPDNWAISFWRSQLPSGQTIYFFDWSRIEHVFVDRPVDLAHEMSLLRADNPIDRRAAYLVPRYPRTVVTDALVAWAEAAGAHQFVTMAYRIHWDTLRDAGARGYPMEIDATLGFLGEIIGRHPHLRRTAEEKHLPWIARELNTVHGSALERIHDFGRLTVRQGGTIQTRTPPGARPKRRAEGEYMISMGDKIENVADVGQAVNLLRELHAAPPEFVHRATQIRRDLGSLIREQYVVHMDEFVKAFGGISVWARTTGTDLGPLTFDQANYRARNWREVQRLEAMEKPPGVTRYEWPDGWTVRELTTQADLDFEGGLMGHCTNKRDYYRVEDLGLNMRLFSLRDPDNLPHATMEWELLSGREYPLKILQDRRRQLGGERGNWAASQIHRGLDRGHVEQLRGKGNAAPLNEYTARMAEFRDVALPIPTPTVEEPVAFGHQREDANNYQGSFSVPVGGVEYQFEVWSKMPYLSDDALADDIGDWLSRYPDLGDYDPTVNLYHWEGPAVEYEWWFARQPGLGLNHSEDELVTATIEAERHGPGMSPLAAIRTRTGRLV
jgi:hypothetical protein